MYGIKLYPIITVKPGKPRIPEIFLQCYCVARKKPNRHEKTKLQVRTWLRTGLLIIVLATLERYARRSVYVKDITRFIG